MFVELNNFAIREYNVQCVNYVERSRTAEITDSLGTKHVVIASKDAFDKFRTKLFGVYEDQTATLRDIYPPVESVKPARKKPGRKPKKDA